MSLYSLENLGLALWENYSKKSEKYKPGECFTKWKSFDSERRDRLSLSSLHFWANEDSKDMIIPKGSKRSKPDDYLNILEMMGYSFSLNLMDDSVYQNGVMINDVSEACILHRMNQHDYRRDVWSKRSILVIAEKNSFHPIRDYLNSLVWDGEDHIGKLCSYFKEKEDEKLFSFYLKKWLVGAIARAYATLGKPVRVVMLVLDGEQNIGKSFFVFWLCSPLPAFFIEDAIYPEEKDYKLKLLNSWIWEVKELGSTTRKADREALKGFITTADVKVRPPYGHHDIQKPAITNFIGTINPEGGFLNDPTGSRRFMVVSLDSIDWNYSKDIDINQVWAQSKELYLKGEKWELTPKEIEIQNDVNEKYRIYNPLTDDIRKYFIIEKGNTKLFTTSEEIINTLGNYGVIKEKNKYSSMQIAEALTELKCKQTSKYINGVKKRGWSGISITYNKDINRDFSFEELINSVKN